MEAVLADGHNGVARIVEKEEQGRADAVVFVDKPKAPQAPFSDQTVRGCVIVEVGHFDSFLGLFSQKLRVFPIFFG